MFRCHARDRRTSQLKELSCSSERPGRTVSQRPPTSNRRAPVVVPKRGQISMSHRVVVVTGASAGVGRATAHAFGRLGCKVALIARNAERLDKAADEVRA